MRVLTKRRKPRRVSVDRLPKYRAWLGEQLCIVCAYQYPGMPLRSMTCQVTRSEACHTRNNGRASKGPDSSCIPLCARCHAEMDGRLSTAITTKAAFAAKYGLNLAAEAAAHYKRFLEEAA